MFIKQSLIVRYLQKIYWKVKEFIKVYQKLKKLIKITEVIEKPKRGSRLVSRNTYQIRKRVSSINIKITSS